MSEMCSAVQCSRYVTPPPPSHYCHVCFCMLCLQLSLLETGSGAGHIEDVNCDQWLLVGSDMISNVKCGIFVVWEQNVHLCCYG